MATSKGVLRGQRKGFAPLYANGAIARTESMSEKTKKQIIIGIGVDILLVLLIAVLLVIRHELTAQVPMLSIETPQKISRSETEEITLDITISSFGTAIYPAASISIAFDPARLEFIGIEEGNVFIRSNEGDVTQKLPDWNCNPEQCNKSGKINIMYLDTTGGKNAFSKELLEEKDNVVLRLKFRLRGSVRTGDVCDLIFDDAVFAASNEEESLAMTRDTLKVRNGRIVIGE